MQHRWLLIVLLFLPAISYAQDKTKLRKIGNENTFRVITRFNDTRAPVLKSPFSQDFKNAFAAKDWAAANKLLPKNAPQKVPFDLQWAVTKFRLAEKTGDVELASVSYQTLKKGSDRDSVLRDYYRVYGAHAALTAKKYEEAAELAGMIKPKERLHELAAYLFAEALYLKGDLKRGRRAFGAATKLYPKSRHRISALWTAAKAERETNPKKAGELAKEILISSPGSRFEKPIRAWLKEHRVKMPSNSVDDLKRKYGHLFRAHRSEQVVEELPNRLTIAKKGTEDWCELKYFVARSYTKLRKHPEAVKAYAPMLKHCPQTDGPYLKALYQTGRSQWNSGKPRKALTTFERLAKKFPKHSYADDALNYQVRILRELGDHKKAESKAKKQLETYPDGDMAADAKWFAFRRAFANKSYKQAVKVADSFDDKGDVYSGGRLTYFAARATQLDGQVKEAVERYNKVIKEFPASYYALLSVNRLGELNKTSDKNLCKQKQNCPYFSASFSEIKIPTRIKNDVRFQRGQLLSAIGFEENAKREFLSLRGAISKDERWALAKVLHEAGAYPYSHDLARRHLGDWEQTFPSNDVRWAISYPQPFFNAVTKASQKHGVDRAIIYAIMREESGFNPSVLSWAGAHGLLQLMPDTARTTAKKSGTKYGGRATLFESDVAIDIGTAYMANLSSKGDGHPALIIAGYNGGWGNIDRWLKELPVADLDLWVEDITYGQTRKYTKRVLRSYWIYKMLSGVAGPKLPMRVR